MLRFHWLGIIESSHKRKLAFLEHEVNVSGVVNLLRENHNINSNFFVTK